jgi:hypothetical protein
MISAALLLACSSEGTNSPSPSAPTTSATPIVTHDFCKDLPVVGDVVRTARRGTETASELVARISEVEDVVQTDIADASNSLALPELRLLVVRLGQLKLAVDSAGDRYPYDAVVQIRAKTIG